MSSFLKPETSNFNDCGNAVKKEPQHLSKRCLDRANWEFIRVVCAFFYFTGVPRFIKMRNCFVPKCDNTCKDNPRRMMFMAPKDEEMFRIWKDVLPKKREFKRIDKVCERHFTKDDIITTFDHIINGELLQMERGRPRLKSNAVPSLNLDLDPHISQRSSNRRRTIARSVPKKSAKSRQEQDFKNISPEKAVSRSAVVKADDIKKEERTENDSREKRHSVDVVIDVDDDEMVLDEYDALYDDVFEVTLPSTLWGIHREPDRQFIAFTCFDANYMQSVKCVVLKANGNLKIGLNGRTVSEQNFTNEINPEFISNVLNEVDETSFCGKWNERKDCELIVPEGAELCAVCS